MQDLKDGVFEALVVQDPFKMGHEAVRTLADKLGGEVAGETAGSQRGGGHPGGFGKAGDSCAAVSGFEEIFEVRASRRRAGG